MGNFLAITTSSQTLSVAVRKGRGPILEKKISGGQSHAENLLPTLDKLLKKSRLKLNDLDTFLIDRGPGSFTGLRISFATLKGFLAVQKKDCYGALSLDMIAEACRLPEGSRLWVVLDAYRQKIYGRLYEVKRGRWKANGKVRVLSFEEWSREFELGSFAAGNALIRYHAEFAKLGERITPLPEKFWFPKASTLIRLFDEKNASLKLLRKGIDFSPLYFRLSEAEEKSKR